MPKPDCQRVPCPHCTRGRNGNQSCCSGFRTRSLAAGCFLGAYLPDKAPTRVLLTSPNGSWRRKAVAVTHVEAPTCADAWRMAHEQNLYQWIWVHDGIPGESRPADSEKRQTG